jgi:hypothetical protein
VRDACHALSIPFSIWMTRDFTAAQAQAAVATTLCDGFIAEAEIPAQMHGGGTNPQAQNWAELAVALEPFDCDKAVATSFAPFQKWIGGQLLPAPELAKPLIERGWTCMPYVYPAENPGDSVAGKLDYCRHFTHEAAPSILDPGEGWYEPEMVLGVYGGKTLDSPEFNGKRSLAGFSVWDAGEEF